MNGAKNTMSFAVVGEDEVSRLDGLDGNESEVSPSPALPAGEEGVGARVIVIVPPRAES